MTQEPYRDTSPPQQAEHRFIVCVTCGGASYACACSHPIGEEVVPRSEAENLIASLEAVQTDLQGDSDWTRERWDDAVFNALAEARDAVSE